MFAATVEARKTSAHNDDGIGVPWRPGANDAAAADPEAFRSAMVDLAADSEAPSAHVTQAADDSDPADNLYSLREALVAYASDCAVDGLLTVTFDAALNGSRLSMTGGHIEPAYSNTLLQGNGSAGTIISGHSTRGAVVVSSGNTLSLQALTLSGGSVVGGTLRVLDGTLLSNTFVRDGGVMELFSGGVARSIAGNGGTVKVFSGGTVYAGTFSNGRLEIFDGGVASGAITMFSSAVLYADSGVFVASATIRNSASLVVDGGTVSNTVISNFGSATVSAGGSLHMVRIYDSASLKIESGGTVGFAVSALGNASVEVESGGYVRQVVASNGAVVNVFGGAGSLITEDNTSALVSGGSLSGGANVGGYSTQTLVDAGAGMVRGYGDAVQVVSSGGSIWLLWGFGGGGVYKRGFEAIVSSGGEIGTAIMVSSSTMTVEYGGVVSAAQTDFDAGMVVGGIVSTGFALDSSLHLISGGVVLESYLAGDSEQRVLAGGVAHSTYLYDQAVQVLSAGGTANHTRVDSGAAIRVAEDGAVMTGRIEVGGLMYIEAEAVDAEAATLHFLVEQCTERDRELVRELDVFGDFADYAVSVTADQAGGTYQLATGAASFDVAVSLLIASYVLIEDEDEEPGDEGEEEWEWQYTDTGMAITLAAPAVYDRRRYSLRLDGAGRLSLTIDVAEPEAVTVTIAADKVDMWDYDYSLREAMEEYAASGAEPDQVTVKFAGATDRKPIMITEGDIHQAAAETTLCGNGSDRTYVYGGVGGVIAVGADQHLILAKLTVHSALVDHGGLLTVSSGAVAAGTLLGPEGRQVVYGLASGTLISGGRQEVMAGGKAVLTRISGTAAAVGVQVLNIGACGDNGRIYSYGSQHVKAGVAVSHTVISGFSATQEVAAGGSAINATVAGDGVQRVAGYAANTIVNDGGTQRLAGGALAEETTVNYGGLQEVEGIASATLVQGGHQQIRSGGTALRALVGGRDEMEIGRQTVFFGGRAEHTVVQAWGEQHVEAGGVVSSGRVEGAGARQKVYAGATVTGLTVGAEGSQEVWGTASATAVYGAAARQTIESGGRAVGARLYADGEQVVKADGRSDEAVVGSAGRQHVAGEAFDTVVNGFGCQTVAADGLASNTRVNRRGLLELEAGAALRDGEIGSGGSLTVAGEAEVHGKLVIHGGAVVAGTGLKAVDVGGEVILDNGADLGAIGSVSVAGSLRLLGVMNVLPATVTDTLIFDLSKSAADDRGVMLADLSPVTANDFYLSIAADAAGGIYRLAGNAGLFNGSITLTVDGVEAGELTLEAGVSHGGRTYALSVIDGVLCLTAGGGGGSPGLEYPVAEVMVKAVPCFDFTAADSIRVAGRTLSFRELHYYRINDSSPGLYTFDLNFDTNPTRDGKMKLAIFEVNDATGRVRRVKTITVANNGKPVKNLPDLFLAGEGYTYYAQVQGDDRMRDSNYALTVKQSEVKTIAADGDTEYHGEVVAPKNRNFYALSVDGGRNVSFELAGDGRAKLTVYTVVNGKLKRVASYTANGMLTTPLLALGSDDYLIEVASSSKYNVVYSLKATGGDFTAAAFDIDGVWSIAGGETAGTMTVDEYSSYTVVNGGGKLRIMRQVDGKLKMVKTVGAGRSLTVNLASGEYYVLTEGQTATVIEKALATASVEYGAADLPLPNRLTLADGRSLARLSVDETGKFSFNFTGGAYRVTISVAVGQNLKTVGSFNGKKGGVWNLNLEAGEYYVTITGKGVSGVDFTAAQRTFAGVDLTDNFPHMAKHLEDQAALADFGGDYVGFGDLVDVYWFENSADSRFSFSGLKLSAAAADNLGKLKFGLYQENAAGKLVRVKGTKTYTLKAGTELDLAMLDAYLGDGQYFLKFESDRRSEMAYQIA